MFKLFKEFNKKEWGIVFFIFLLVVFSVFLDLRLPEYMSEITRLVQTEGSHFKDILIQGGYMILCAFGSLISTVIVCFFSSILSSSFSYNLRKRLFNQVGSFSTAEMKKFQVSSLITRTTNDVTQVEMFIAMGLQLVIKSPIMAIWAISKIINKSIEWSMLTAGCVVILLSVVGLILFIVLPKFKIVQKLIDRLNGVTRENVTGIRVIRAFNAEKFIKSRFSDVNESLTGIQLFNQRMFAILMPLMNLVMHGLTFGIYLIGAHLINNALMLDKITLFSNMIVFSSYGMQVIMSFLMLAMIFMIWPRAAISASRILEVVETKSSITYGTFAGKTDITGSVEFKNVSFKYPDANEYILKDVSFKVNSGETIAFIGSTGSGKSTLINLIPRFYDATSGSILIDGLDIKEYSEEALHQKIGYVPQKAIMFSDSIKNNVLFGNSGKKRGDQELTKSLEVAQADFVNDLEKGVKHKIAFGGTNVSGGQKQRLSIARAIAYDPEIYIFDDSFSALDYKTDLKLRQELKKHTKDATSMIVAQRIGTIMHADKIVVLDKGKCVGIGTHQELLKNCKVYKEIALSQLSEEELYG